MEFSEQKAKEIVEAHDLDYKTIAVWRTRNKIPDRYAVPSFKIEKRKELNRADEILQSRMLDVMRLPSINSGVYAEIVGKNLFDVVAGKSSFTEGQFILLKKEINRLKVDILKAIENERLLKKIIFDKRIKYNLVLKYTMYQSEIKSLVYYISKDAPLDRFQKEKVKNAMVKLALELNL